MAEDEAENAFFQEQAMNADPTNSHPADQDANASDSDEYDPSSTLQEQYTPPDEDSNPSENVSSDTRVPDSHPKISLPQETDPRHSTGSGYPSQPSSRLESQASTSILVPGIAVQSKARTIGGFVVEDEDEDDTGDAEYEPPVVLGVEEMNTIPSQPIPGNANEATYTPDVSFVEAGQASASAKNVPNSPFPSVPVASKNDGSATLGQNLYNSRTSLQPETARESVTATPTADPPSAPKGRLPHDRVGILEDRIQEDPRGDIPAWLELINEHRSRNRIDSARGVYERFLKVFPLCAEVWVSYAAMESELNELFRLEQIFNRTLLTIPAVQLWTVYLDYVRRRNPLSTDTTGQARRIISSAYDLAIKHIGMDKDSGSIWTDYVQFIRSGPGNVGGSGWQDQQKMDLLRKAYQRAICVPMQALNTFWKEYDQFEMGLNKLTGRKFLQEQSPAYMTARSSYVELQNITRDLNRTTFPRLPPVPGSEGDTEFLQQVEIWKRWVSWERGDPLVLKEEDLTAYKTRVVYVYKQALMALRFLPEIWFEAAEFCFLNNMETEGTEFLKNGVDANPESCLLAFKHADRLEITSESEQDPIKRGTKVREPYDRLLDSLYELISKARTREIQDVTRLEETFTKSNPEKPTVGNDEDDDDRSEAKAKESAKNSQIEAVRNAHSIQIGILSKTISFAWIALMRAMRRIQGKGKPGEIPGSRQVFADARKRGRITSDVYIASALIEYHCYKDPAATKIFERGAKLFPEDENFALEYLKHLIDINDVINARAVFETTVRKLASNPDHVQKTKPIFSFLHEYESRYGDLVQVINLENRMRELFPDDPTLEQFAHRFSAPSFDPTAFRPIISPSQTRPKAGYHGDQVMSRQGTPASRYQEASLPQSPKRPLEDFEDDLSRPRKFIRGESPLKTAQRRQFDQQKRTQTTLQVPTASQYRSHGSPAPLPRDIVFLLSVIPSASAYNAGRFSAEKMVDLIRRLDMPASISQIPLPQSARGLGTGQPTVGGQPFSGNYRS
ncbi:cleavage polyadenylation factor subunit RNA14 [Aspergillus lucknowensis]|uniref:mRNA 3'-end-processing protein RNA14 n=1 Tax=Aspergillus lucknowensis TaxID=176173 RepID=A0ABR4LR02_9EURO